MNRIYPLQVPPSSPCAPPHTHTALISTIPPTITIACFSYLFSPAMPSVLLNCYMKPSPNASLAPSISHSIFISNPISPAEVPKYLFYCKASISILILFSNLSPHTKPLPMVPGPLPATRPSSLELFSDVAVTKTISAGVMHKSTQHTL